MKRQLILCALAILLVVPLSSAAEYRPELQVKRDNTTILRLRMTNGSLAFFNEVPSQLTAVLRERGIDCCSAQTRISATEWKCCHGKFIIVSQDTRVQELLTAVFNGPNVVQR
jgi:hypothetical protein